MPNAVRDSMFGLAEFRSAGASVRAVHGERSLRAAFARVLKFAQLVSSPQAAAPPAAIHAERSRRAPIGSGCMIMPKRFERDAEPPGPRCAPNPREWRRGPEFCGRGVQILARGAMVAAAALAMIVTRPAMAGPRRPALSAQWLAGLHEVIVREPDGAIVHIAARLPFMWRAASTARTRDGEEPAHNLAGGPARRMADGPAQPMAGGPARRLAGGQNAYGAVQMNLATVGGTLVSGSLYDSGNTAMKVNCVVGCSAASSFSDNGAFTTGTTAINVIGAYYTSGAAPSISSGNAGRVRMDSSSFLMVNCQVGCSASAGFADNAAFTAGTTPINIAGGWYSTSPTNCTSGSACAPQLTVDRKLYVQDFQGTSPWVVSANGGSFAVTQSGAWNVGQSGTWNVGQSGSWTVQPGNTPNTTAWLVTGTGGTFPATQSGTWTVQPGNTPNTTPWLTTDSSDMSGTAPGTAPSFTSIVGGKYNSTPPSPTTGQTLPLQLDSSGRVIVNCGSGCGGSGGTSLADEATFTQGSTSFTPAGCLYNTSLTNLTSGQGGAAQCTNDRNLYVNLYKVANTALGAPSNYGTSPGAVNVQGVNAFVTNTPNVNIQSNASINEAQIAGSTVVADPCQVNARSSVNISLTASGQLITGTASKQTYICSADLITATAQNIALVEGTGTTCATGIAGMAGGTTAATGWNLAANDGLVKGVGSNWVFKTATAADNVCLLLSGTGQTSGSVQYVQQ